MSGETVFINGRFSDAADATLPALDAAIQHGVGLFETILGGVSDAGAPWAMLLEDHVDRLTSSARELGLSTSLRPAALAEAVLETAKRAGHTRARMRLTVTGGPINALAAARSGEPPSRAEPSIIITAAPATIYPRAMLERGVRIAVADSRANPFNPVEGHKTINYWWRLRELAAAAAKESGEALILSVTNHVCSGCVSNVFIVRGGEAITPLARDEAAEAGAGTAMKGGAQLPSPVRPGTTRAWAVAALANRGITVKRRAVAIGDVLDADEVFLTNSSWGVLPVNAVEGKTIGAGSAGPIAMSLVDAWEAEVAAAAGSSAAQPNG